VFPLSVRGSVRLKLASAPAETAIKATLDRIGEMLDEEAANDVIVDQNEVRFSAGMRRDVSNWNVLLQFDTGRIWIEPQDTMFVIKYDLSTLQILLTVTLVVAGLSALAFLVHGLQSDTVKNAATTFAIGWGWLFGMNYITGTIRFPRWLRKGLRDMPGLKNS
jgi:hypothetical protein